MTKKITLILLCACVVYLANTGRYFGVFIHQFFPCTQNPEHSFPCFGWVDIAVIVVALLTAAYATGQLVMQLFKSPARH